MSLIPGLMAGLGERLRRRMRPQLRVDAAYRRWQSPVTAPPAAGPLISILMPVYDPAPRWLAAAILSVLRQDYPCWQLCIADDASRSPEVAIVLRELAGQARVRMMTLPANGGIAAATNAALAMAEGAFVALLDHDDVLAPHALGRVAAECARYPDAALIFSDEDQVKHGRRCCPYFKPGWNPDLMFGQNAVSHFGAYRRDRLLALGGVRAGFEGSQDYELALRFAASCGPARIRHVPDVLYHWRQSAGAFSAAHADRAHAAARLAVAAHVEPGAQVGPDPVLPQFIRVVHPLPKRVPSVEIVVADGSEPPAGARDLPGAERRRGDVVVFLAAGLHAAREGWLRELVSQAMRPGVGAVGGRLDGPDGRIAQSGLVLDPWRVAVTLRPGSDLDDPGYFGHFRLARTVSAVSLHCLAIRRDVLERTGGIDPACDSGPFADVDLCLRLACRGLRCVWTPHARLRYTVLPRRLTDRRAARRMRAVWGVELSQDPYLNPNLRVRHGNLLLRRHGHAA